MATSSQVLQRWVKLSPLHTVEEILNILVGAEVITSPSDFYKLTIRHLLTFPEITYSDAANVLEAIDKSRNMGMPRALLALLPDMDESIIKSVSTSPHLLDDIFQACVDSQFADDLIEQLEKLTQLGVKLDFRDDSIFDPNETPFTGKKVTISGSLSASHSVVKGALESFGATVVKEISKDVDFLLLGEGAGEVVNLAIKNRVEIITELDIEKMMGLTD